jgi:hypothetical protein
MRSLYGFTVAYVLLFPGCGHDSDPYDQAMKRLVAEQQQLDWIDEKIAETSVQGYKDANEWIKLLNELGSQGHNKEELAKELQRTLQGMNAHLTKFYGELDTLKQKRAEQADRVEKAREAADAIQ